MTDSEQYLTAFYFTITTITTVGYGDIPGGTQTEKAGAILLMILGVIAFSVSSASLTSIFSSHDKTEAAIKERLEMLQKLQAEYMLPLKLCSEIVKTIKSEYQNTEDDRCKFVSDMPQKIK